MKSLIHVVFVAMVVGTSVAARDKRCSLGQFFHHIPETSTIKANTAVLYRFTVDYINADSKRDASYTERVIGDYEFTPRSGDTLWRTVRTGRAPGSATDVSTTEHQAYLEGMHYDRSAKPLSSGFFDRFPAQAATSKNLVLDTWMFDEFIQGYFDKLQPNAAVPFVSGEVAMGNTGAFRNNDVRLTWIGVSRRNNRDCALVRYEAFLNKFSLDVSGMKISARSEYWGEMWVALESRSLEYATIREEVVGTLTTTANGTRPIHTLRVDSWND